MTARKQKWHKETEETGDGSLSPGLVREKRRQRKKGDREPSPVSWRNDSMKIFPKSNDTNEYLKSDAVVDYTDENVSKLVDSLYEQAEDSMDYIRKAYEYVRDRIPHSADINAEEVACSASEVLKTGHGICFAKSHLLAALLRYKGIPAGFCYQRLILDDETSPELIIHGLNGVYLEDKKTWIRLDARGSKEGVNARFSVTDEQLAFPVRPEKGERDGKFVYADPDPDVLAALQSHNSRSQLWTDLPAKLPDSEVMATQRLILRRWEDSDAEGLYEYASDPDVGPIAGWPPHQSIEESRDVIKNVLSGKEAYAICLKEDGKAIGTIELKLNGHTDMTDRDDECEMGYWLGKPFWGRGIMPEAVREMLRHAFEDCGMQKVWIGYYEGNSKSKRVQEKCGFKYQWRSENVDVPLMHEKRTGHVNLMTKEDWKGDRETGDGSLSPPPFPIRCLIRK